MSRQFALITIAPSGLRVRRKSSTASDLRLGFQLAQSSEPSARIVGRSKARLRALRLCASSTQAILNPSSDLIESAVWSCIPRKMIRPSPGVSILSLNSLNW